MFWGPAFCEKHGLPFVEVDANGQDAAAILSRVAGVTGVTEAERHGSAIGFEVASEQGRDIRRELAQAVVGSGCGLLEMRPMRVSLEEIFLSLTTEESSAQAAEEPVNA